MSVLKNIKSLFIIEEEMQEGKTADKGSAKKESVPSVNALTKNIPSSGAKGEATTKFLDVLFSAMEKSNIQGFDYMEYKQSLQSLAKMPMDEATRYKSAFAMAQTMGVTPKKLMEAAQFYINVLGEEERKFDQALNAQKEKQVGNKMKKAKQLENLIQQKAEKIKKLTEEIEAHQNQVAATNQEIQAATGKLETTKANFHASYDLMVSQIQGDIDNMKKYLA